MNSKCNIKQAPVYFIYIDTVEDKTAESEKKIDTIRQYHFNYDIDTCLVDRYPEAAAKDNKTNKQNEISVAPGEGHRPSNILTDKK